MVEPFTKIAAGTDDSHETTQSASLPDAFFGDPEHRLRIPIGDSTPRSRAESPTRSHVSWFLSVECENCALSLQWTTADLLGPRSLPIFETCETFIRGDHPGLPLKSLIGGAL